MKQIDSIRKDYLNIPVGLCSYVLREKLSSPFQLYIYLKTTCQGKRRIAPSDYKDIAQALGRTPRTVRNNLKKLQELNWVGYNPGSGIYFVRGFDKLREMLKIQYRTGAEFDIKNLKDIKSFVVGSVIGYMVRQQRSKEKRRRLEQKKACQFRSRHGRLPSFYPISSKVLAKIFNISTSTAQDYRRLAHKAGYITLRKIDPEPLLIKKPWKGREIEVPVHVKRYRELKSEFPLRIKDNMLFIQQAYKAKNNLAFMKKKKIDTL